MSIDIETARRVAKLARIRVAPEDLPELAGQLSGILTFMEQLNEVDVTGIEPMTSVTPMRLSCSTRASHSSARSFQTRRSGASSRLSLGRRPRRGAAMPCRT